MFVRSYRYGFNGKEKYDEVKVSAGTQYDYGFRIYDPRIGKFLSRDLQPTPVNSK
jgi:RHS repeat-associated protein